MLRANGVELRADASEVPVGNVKISRDATNRTMTIAVLDEGTDITDFDLRITGTDIDRTTRINFRRPFVVPPTITLNDGTRSQTITDVPQVALLAGGETIPTNATNLPIGPLKITRNNAARTMTIAPREEGVPIAGHVLSLSGAGGINASTTVSYAPPPGELPTAITLDSTNSSRVVTAVPAQALTATVNGTAVAVPVTANNLDVGGGLKITRDNTARTLTIAPLNAANRVPAVALTLGGTGLTSRTTTVSYAPPAADIEMTFPATTTLTGSPPSAVIPGLPNRRLTLNGTTNIDAGGTATVGDLVFTRAAGDGASITVTPRLPRTAVPGAAIRIGGTGVTERTTTISYAPPPLPAAAELPGTISLTGDPPRMVIAVVPNQELTATVDGTSVPLPLTANNVSVGGGLKISRNSGARTLTIEPMDRAVRVPGTSLSISGTDLATRTATVSYEPPPPSVEIPADAALTGTPPSLVVNNVPAADLRLNPGNVLVSTTASNVRIGDLKVSRSGTTMTITPFDIDTAVASYSVEFTGTGITSRTSRISYVVPDLPAFVLPATLTLAGAPPEATVNNLPERLLRANGSVDLPVNATNVRVGDLKISRTNNGRTMTVTPFSATTAVPAYRLTLRGRAGTVERATDVTYVVPALPAIPAGVDLRGDDQTHTIRNIPDGRLEVMGTAMEVNDTLYFTSAGASVAATATNVALTVSRLAGGSLQFTASPDREFTLRVRIRRNGDAADQNFNFHYTP